MRRNEFHEEEGQLIDRRLFLLSDATAVPIITIEPRAVGISGEVLVIGLQPRQLWRHRWVWWTARPRLTVKVNAHSLPRLRWSVNRISEGIHGKKTPHYGNEKKNSHAEYRWILIIRILHGISQIITGFEDWLFWGIQEFSPECGENYNSTYIYHHACWRGGSCKNPRPLIQS